ncbi:MAG: type III pantothenate kinase [Verrucomicrobiota bacterium]|nr:type III pantothenate kinase [Verrucomicrobiota bacterium]
MVLLIDIGNTHTHVAAVKNKNVIADVVIPSNTLTNGKARPALAKLIRLTKCKTLSGAVFCSVVPRLNQSLKAMLREHWNCPTIQLTPKTVVGIGIDYPKPNSIGADRLANSIAAHAKYGGPVIIVDFGTAVTFDIVDAAQNYIGGIITPGLAVMTEYLHEKTALLPKIKITEPSSVIGKNTQHAMLSGAVIGYRGLISELLRQLKKELDVRKMAVIATGGYAKLIAKKIPSIQKVDPLLTIKGLRLVGKKHRPTWWQN